MKPIVLYKCSKSIRLYEKLGNNPFSTFLLIIYLTQSKACKLIVALFFNSVRYSSSVLVSSASLARLIVDTLTEPTFNAVPPTELKYPRSRISDLSLQQFDKLFTEESTKILLSDHFMLCLIAHSANSLSSKPSRLSKSNLPCFLNKLMVLTGKVNIQVFLISDITSIYHF